MSDEDSSASGEVIVQLLDPTYRKPVKTWKFTDRTEVSIGREAERDVEISDPYVSRLHAELHFRDDRWRLVARGRNGVVVGTRPITELTINSDVLFRLGPAGPLLRFSTGEAGEDNSSTLCFDVDTIPVFLLDETKVREDVGEIATGDYFQNLQQKVGELRRQRHNR